MAVTDDMLMAWLDGELGAAERADVEAALAVDAALRARLEQQRRLRARLAAHYAPVVTEDVPERLRAMLEPKVVDLAQARASRARPLWQSLAAIAATLVLGIAIGTRMPGGDAGPVVVRGGAMVASGALAEALDTQLAAAQPADATTRIGVSFARANGQWCRTFDSAAVSGLACRDAGDWRMVATAAGAGAERGEYHQAGSAASLVLQAAQDLMAGEPLDADAERRARDSGWRPRG